MEFVDYLMDLPGMKLCIISLEPKPVNRFPVTFPAMSAITKRKKSSEIKPGEQLVEGTFSIPVRKIHFEIN